MGNILQNVKKSIQNWRWGVLGKMQSRNPKLFKMQEFTVPFSAGAGRIGAIKGGAGAIKTTGLAIKNFFTKLPNLIKSKTISPAAGLPIGKIPKALGKAALGGAIAGTTINLAYQGSKGTITGETPNIMDVIESARKSAQLGATFGISPIGALFGTVRGTEILTGKKAKDVILNLFGATQDNISKIPDTITSKIPDFPNTITPTNTFNISYPSDLQGFSGPQGVYYQAPSPVFSPSLSLQGSAGMGDNLPLLLMLLGGGAGIGGYILGKRKRKKKKKYKKRRS